MLYFWASQIGTSPWKVSLLTSMLLRLLMSLLRLSVLFVLLCGPLICLLQMLLPFFTKDGPVGGDPAFHVIWSRFRMMRRYLAYCPGGLVFILFGLLPVRIKLLVVMLVLMLLV